MSTQRACDWLQEGDRMMCQQSVCFIIAVTLQRFWWLGYTFYISVSEDQHVGRLFMIMFRYLQEHNIEALASCMCRHMYFILYKMASAPIWAWSLLADKPGLCTCLRSLT
jgi:hypothetical protein